MIILLLLLYLSKCNVLVLNLILLEYLIDNKYIYPLLVNFFYKLVDQYQNAKEKHFLLHYVNMALTRSLLLFFGTIIINKLEINVLSTKS